jgi:magnesium transporter
VISVFLNENGVTQCVERVDPAWLTAESRATLWVDIVQPSATLGQQLLADTFKFHPLSVEDALSEIHHPKIETYPGYLYVILHGIDLQDGRAGFATRDVDFFIGRNYLVTVHDGHSRSIAAIRDVCDRHQRLMADGPLGLMHRIVDMMVDNYGPEIDRIEERMNTLEDEAILGTSDNMMRPILAIKRDLASLRRVLIPQRDVLGRLARREFPQISDEMAYRFRDVYDHVVRYAEEATLFQDRMNGILEGHLSAISNRLNTIMKVLTLLSTIFMPLTLLTGLWGINVPLPHFPGGERMQFWWLTAIMMAMIVGMLLFFRRKRWI